MEPTLEASTRRMSKQLPESSDIPLCVDLDATLVKTDLLWEGVFLLLKENWCALLCLPLWWWKGIAQVKYEIARRTWPDFELLPYRSDVLELIHQAHADGRHVVLVSAAHELLASKVARHLDLFHEVIATRGLLNLKGEQKRLALEERFGRKRFDYVGNDRADLPVWAAARRAYVVTNNRRLLRRAEAVACISSIKAGTSVLRAQARGMRLHQWSKNILVFVPIITAHQIAHPRILAKGVVAFFAFGLVSSSVYLVNDLLDLQADRAHKIKRVRPFAAGDVSAAHGFMLASLLLVLGLTLSIVAGVPLVGALLAGYFAMSFVYSCFLKRVVILDVLLLAGFYTLRIFAGGAATRIAVSGWLLAFSMFFFFGLALVKRCSELMDEVSSPAGSRGYLASYLPQVKSLGVASGFVSALVLVLYVMSPEVTVLYRRPWALLAICPLVLYWINRVWRLTMRGMMNEDPIVFALRDGTSYFVGFLSALAMYIAI